MDWSIWPSDSNCNLPLVTSLESSIGLMDSRDSQKRLVASPLYDKLRRIKWTLPLCLWFKEIHIVFVNWTYPWLLVGLDFLRGLVNIWDVGLMLLPRCQPNGDINITKLSHWTPNLRHGAAAFFWPGSTSAQNKLPSTDSGDQTHFIPQLYLLHYWGGTWRYFSFQSPQ